ncbi:MAG: hypothetical protein IT440_01170 [Phycisphaeraceae bacterium]|nr:hypothetical protein [Phycisphaeraceae bacterium]
MKEPIWVHGRVPNGYWSTRTNRLKYLNWLGKRLKFAKLEDWYGLTRTSFSRNYGGGLLATVYRDSPMAALRDLAPNYAWKPWLLSSTPQRYWRDIRNRRAFMDWLGQQLKFRKPEDWYALRGQDVRRFGGAGLLHNIFGGSAMALLRDYKPDRDWKPWLMASVPQRYWHNADNRRAYMDWLGKRLKFTKPEHWYQLRAPHIENNGGMTLLQSRAGNSPQRLLREYIPGMDWHPWLFPRVPRGYWTSRENRRSFVKWLAEQLGLSSPRQWQDITGPDIRKFGGGAMLNLIYHGNVTKLLEDCTPAQRTKVKRSRARRNRRALRAA